ncbi:hypothetical protein AB205_0070540 [Aquarana catesbeiana]|uniref:Helicase ATP-binding domain-containing protein n=1 Tax=Aquarana catesbeiana TaxID=8400 RepID=A0A2G9QFC4_AQUCT|nr:hypothetical protein AB205_0070540 [Aquarana catesbeiana]
MNAMEDLVATEKGLREKFLKKNVFYWHEFVYSEEYAELAISSLSFNQPTPIQKACIPVGLLGRDICACAATGTGKTAAFMLPVLERLIYKPREAPVTRVLVLVPTRELGIQVHTVARQLAQFSEVTCCLTVGECAG